jgi:type II secretory pathway predicted ATPase ExeA
METPKRLLATRVDQPKRWRAVMSLSYESNARSRLCQECIKCIAYVGGIVVVRIGRYGVHSSIVP